MTTPVDSLLEQFVAGGWPFIAHLPNETRTESLHIDYKQTKTPEIGPAEREDCQNLSIALSGFANADGGIVVWGVKARPDKDGIDQVQEIVSLKQLAQFRSDLQTLTCGLRSTGRTLGGS